MFIENLKERKNKKERNRENRGGEKTGNIPG
jgi:hypothetical protein